MAKYALVIANNQYTDPGLAQLSAPGRDAEDFARVLRAKEIGAFEDVKILLNQPEASVSEAIDDLFTQKKADDLLVLYFSGHGVRDEQGALYLAVTNTNRARLRSTGIKSDFIRESMDQSRSRRQVLILDCCNSGAFAQGTKAAVGVTIGTSTAFEGTGYGRVVLTATDATQFAWEGDRVIGETQTSNSLFTHFLVKGLEGEADLDGNGKITVDELYDYAYEQIVSRTPWQTPGKWSYKQQGEIVLRQTAMEEMKPAALPADLLTALESSYPSFREAAVRQLDELMKGKNAALVISARAALERVAASDDSRHVAKLAAQVLEPYRQAELQADSTAAQSAETPSRTQEAARSSLNRQAEPISTVILEETVNKASNSQINWVTAFWIALTWSVCLLASGATTAWLRSASGSEYGWTDWVGAALFGTLGGLSTGLILRRVGALKDWKSLLIISLGFGIGNVITTVIGNSIGNQGGDTPAFIKGYALGGTMGGALGGLAVGLCLLKDRALSAWKSSLIITAGYALGFGLGLWILLVLYVPIENQAGSLAAQIVSGAIGGAFAGGIAGAATVYWLKREKLAVAGR